MTDKRQRTIRFFFIAPTPKFSEFIANMGNYTLVLSKLRLKSIRYVENPNGDSMDHVVFFSSCQIYDKQWKTAVETIFGITCEFHNVSRISYFVNLVESHPQSRLIQPPQVMALNPALPSPNIIYVPMIAVAQSAQALEEPGRVREAAEGCPEPKHARVESSVPDEPVQPVSDDIPLLVNVTADKAAELTRSVLEFLDSDLAVLTAPVVFEENFGVWNRDGLKYVTKKKNVLPAPFDHIQLLFPEFMKKPSDVLKKLSQSHAQCLGKIRQYLLHGIFEYYVYPVMIQIDYSVDSLNIFEIHRRILALELGLSRMANYMNGVCKNRAVTKPCLDVQLRNMIHLVLFRGTGLFGSGKSFFTVDTTSLRSIEVIQDFKRDELGVYRDAFDTVNWLKENRDACMVHQSLAFTGHCLVHVTASLTLALNAKMMTTLTDGEKAQEFQNILYLEKMHRRNLCKSEVLPMVKYGAYLTEYYKSVYQACDELSRCLRAIKSLPMPDNIALSPVMVGHGKVQLTDDFNNPIANGHMDLLKKKIHYLIPFPVSGKSINVNTFEEKMLAAERFDAWRKSLFQSFKEKFPRANPSLFDAIYRGDEKVLRCFNGDSHELNATASFPATASLPHAKFVPAFPFQ